MIQFSVLGSGSRGNAVYIESPQTAILIDCGFSGKELAARLAAIGKDMSRLSAILVTHEHTDHISGVGVLSRRCGLEVHINEGTLGAAAKKVGQLSSVKMITTGDKYSHFDMQIKSFQISHDTADPVGFVISVDGVSLGYCTDTGKITHLMSQRLKNCQGLIVECNHDPKLLKNGPYPLSLQQRVRSSHGHLANCDAIRFLSQIYHDNLQHIVLAHLSEQNNDPDVVRKEVAEGFLTMQVEQGNSVVPTIHLANQHFPLPLISLG